ncbi:MAG: ABC transporter substrate-binding protein, partial [Alphaproteobacteria bacterium]|nr:ABC transporter substrate-binding protein [Alphaproteobacteria bacterium]
MRRSLLTATATAAVLAAGVVQADEIRIGVLYPIAGTGAVYGEPAMHGHNMAVDELNAAGGILGKKIVSFARDTKLKPAAASAAAKELITKDGVNVLVG